MTVFIAKSKLNDQLNKLEIKNVPNGLNKVVCSKDYKYINNFKDLEIESY